MENFDYFVGIDWSGAEKPLKNPAISLAMCQNSHTSPMVLPGPWSRQAVADWIVAQSQKNKRMLIGFDCNFSYAESIATQQLGEQYTILDLWASVEMACQGVPNFFAKKFWEKNAQFFWLAGTKPEWFKAKNLQREIEKTCVALGFGYPESPFKLFSQKQVGKGGLAGMRLAYYLKQVLEQKIAFWPYESESKATKIIVAEIYPRLFWRLAGFGNKKVIDRVGLNKGLTHFCSKPFASKRLLNNHDTDALISAAGMRWLCEKNKEVPKALIKPTCMDPNKAKREGWILGVK